MLRLSIELVPSTAWFNNLRNMVGTDKWDIIRKKCYKEAGYRCEICGGRGSKWPVECHEKWLFNEENHRIELQGLIALCPSCHEVKHMGLAMTRGRYDEARQHFMKINKLNAVEADRHISAAFSVYQRRSEYEWELCISAIDRYLD